MTATRHTVKISTRIYTILKDTAKEYEIPLTQALNLLIFGYPVPDVQAITEEEIRKLKKRIKKLTERVADLEVTPKNQTHAYILTTREKEVRP